MSLMLANTGLGTPLRVRDIFDNSGAPFFHGISSVNAGGTQLPPSPDFGMTLFPQETTNFDNASYQDIQWVFLQTEDVVGFEVRYGRGFSGNNPANSLASLSIGGESYSLASSVNSQVLTVTKAFNSVNTVTIIDPSGSRFRLYGLKVFVRI